MNFRKLILFNLILLVVSDALLYIGNMGISNEYMVPAALTAKFLVLFSLFYFAKKSDWKDNLTKTTSALFFMMIVWDVITIIRGAFLANDYWDWKFLFFNSGFFFMIPLAFFVGKSLSLTKAAFYYVLNFIFLVGFLAIPLTFLTNPELYSRLMIPVSFFIVMIPYVKPKDKLLIIIVAVISVLIVIDYRTNVIRIVVSFLVLFTWYFRRIISVTWFKIMHVVLLFAPLVLLFLGATGQYNIFSKASENEGYVVTDNKANKGSDESLTVDTRSFIYIEVFKTLSDHDSWLIGESAVGKYKTESFDNLVKGNERFGSEVGFLNTLLYSGLIGVLLYGLMLFIVSYNAIYHSANWLCKMLGLVIMMRWVLFFMEEYTQFDLNFYFLWVIIGLVSLKQFRAMSDARIAQFLFGNTLRA